MLTFCGLLATLAVAADRGGDAVIQQRVDLIELHHYIDDSGRHVFDQLIFYDWSYQHHRYHVRAWRLVKSPSQLPDRHWNPDQYRCVWHDEGLLRAVWAPVFREIWSPSDPERENRKYWPEAQRPDLRRPAVAGLAEAVR